MSSLAIETFNAVADLVRRHPHLVEQGLTYHGHAARTVWQALVLVYLALGTLMHAVCPSLGVAASRYAHHVADLHEAGALHDTPHTVLKKSE